MLNLPNESLRSKRDGTVRSGPQTPYLWIGGRRSTSRSASNLSRYRKLPLRAGKTSPNWAHLSRRTEKSCVRRIQRAHHKLHTPTHTCTPDTHTHTRSHILAPLAKILAQLVKILKVWSGPIQRRKGNQGPPSVVGPWRPDRGGSRFWIPADNFPAVPKKAPPSPCSNDSKENGGGDESGLFSQAAPRVFLKKSAQKHFVALETLSVKGNVCSKTRKFRCLSSLLCGIPPPGANNRRGPGDGRPQ